MGFESSPADELAYHVRIHDEGPDGLWAEVKELPGCFASGMDMDELMESLTEGISLYLPEPHSPIQVVLEGREPIRGEHLEEQRYLVLN